MEVAVRESSVAIRRLLFLTLYFRFTQQEVLKIMANKQVKVRSLKRHAALHDKQWNPTQDESMGKMIRMLNLVLPAETDDKGKPKGEPEVIPLYVSGGIATVGDTNALTVPPHINQWCRLLFANHFSGDTDKGRGYSLAVASNTAAFEKDTIEPLIKRGAIVEGIFGKKERKVHATFEQLFTVAVLQAHMLQQTAERWPEAEEVVEITAKEDTPPVEVAFTL
jgi:hypothetical protein